MRSTPSLIPAACPAKTWLTIDLELSDAGGCARRRGFCKDQPEVTKSFDAVVAAFHRRPIESRYKVLMLDDGVLSRGIGAAAMKRRFSWL